MEKFTDFNFDVTKIIIACHIPYNKGEPVHKNRPYHGLVFFPSGEKEYAFSDRKVIRVKPGDIIYLPKYSNYDVSDVSPGDCYAINFEIDKDEIFAPFSVHMKNSSKTEEHFNRAKKEWDMKSPGYLFKCKAELYNLLYAVAKDYHSSYMPSDKYRTIQPAVEYIHRNYLTYTPDIAGLSEMCGITPEYFRKIFKSFYGISPLKYINNLKINHAKELIESRMYSVTDAALQSGYSDMSHFSREFKKVVGVCPSDFKLKTKK